MCFLLPLKVKQISDTKVKLENGLEALCDINIKDLKVGDEVLVYGNLIINKVTTHDKTN